MSLEKIFWVGVALAVVLMVYLATTPIPDVPPPHPPMNEPGYPRYTTTINKDIYGRQG
jgi:hypothetical protein